MNAIAFKISLCALFAFIFVLNVLYPLAGDDFLYLKESVGLESIISFYSNWNARLYDLLYQGFIVRVNPYAFDVFNAIAGVVFIVGFYALLFWDFKRRLIADDAFYLALMLFLLCVGCNFDGIFLWGCGSVNYLWSGVGVVLIALHIKAFLLKVPIKYPKVAIAFLLILSLFTAMSHELWALFMIIAYFVLYVAFHKTHKFPLYYKISFVLCVLGLLYIMMAPGTSARIAFEIEKYDYLSISQLLALSFSDKVSRVYVVLSNFASKTPHILLWLVFIGAFFSIYKTGSIVKKITLFTPSFALFCVILWQIPLLGICILLAMNILCYYYDRKKLIFLVLFTLWILMGFTQLQFGKNFNVRARSVDLILLIAIAMLWLKTYTFSRNFKAILSFLMVAFFAYTIYQYADMRLKWNALVAFVEEQKAIYGSEAEIVYSADKFKIDYFMIGSFFNINADKKYEYFGLDYVFDVKSVEFK